MDQQTKINNSFRIHYPPLPPSLKTAIIQRDTTAQELHNPSMKDGNISNLGTAIVSLEQEVLRRAWASSTHRYKSKNSQGFGFRSAFDLASVLQYIP